MPDIQQITDDYKGKIMKRESSTVREITALYNDAMKNINVQIAALTQKIQAAKVAGEDVNILWLHQNIRLHDLTATIKSEIDQFANDSLDTVTQAQLFAAKTGQIQSIDMLNRETQDSPVKLTFNSLPVDALQNFAGRASNGSPLHALFSGMGTTASHDVTDAIYTAIATGAGSRETANVIQNAVNTTHARALTISRTETLQAYRGASLDIYKRNSDVVEQWRWMCEKSVNTCAMCLAMDGSLHDLDETLDSHPNCRCVATPVTKSWDDILSPLGIDASDIPETSHDTYQTGQEWFDDQSSDKQREILGPAKFDAYQDGTISSLSDLVGTRNDPQWGSSYYELPLKDIN